MKILLALGCLMLSATSFASPQADLSIAHGEGEKCFMKSFMATEPTDEQKATCEEIHGQIKKTYEENKSNMMTAAMAFMQVMKAHPIAMDQAIATAHDLGKAVHPVQAAMFSGSIQLINVLTADQRTKFDAAMKACSEE